MIIATAGHVDHGKTLLVNCLTGIQTDRLQEEQERGLTIDLGFAYMQNEGNTIGFIDVPGHIKFISNMLAGVSTIDFAMLVIAADDGPMPQTLEHLAILNILDINFGCIALTKIDRVDSPRLQEVKKEIQNILQGTQLSESPIFEVSSTEGLGLDALKDHLWQSAKQVALAKKTQAGHFRLAIDRSFTKKGSGVVVTGSVFSGKVDLGDDVYLMPAKKLVRVRGIHTQSVAAESGEAGDRCAINLSGDIKKEEVSRGHWLSSNQSLPHSTRIDVLFHTLASEQKEPKHWTPVHIHAAAQHVTGRLAILDKDSLAKGQSGFVQLVLSEPINVCYGDKIVIRDQSAERTIGGAVVLDPFAPSRGRAKQDRLDFLNSMLEKDTLKRLELILQYPELKIHLDDLKANFNLKHIDIDTIGFTDKKGYLFSKNKVEQASSQILDGLKKWQKNFPQGNAPTLNQLSNIVPLPSALYTFVLDRLVQAKELKPISNEIQLMTHQAEIPSKEQTFWLSVKPILESDMLKPPVLHELARTLNLPPTSLDKRLKALIPYGLLLKPVKNRFYLPEAISELKSMAILTAEDQNDGKFTVINFRDRTQVGRNLSIEILEYFDHTGFTKRIGDFRIIQDKTR